MKAWKGSVRPWLNLSVLLGASFFANHAAAQTCATDQDCGAGYSCKVTGVTACATNACRPGTSCPPPPPCESQEFRSCVNAACSGDSDCPDPMLCHLESVEECDGGGASTKPASCPPDAPNCVVPAPLPIVPPSCTTHTESTCRQPYELPCTADADCGGGFRCAEITYGWCQGSGAASKDGGVVKYEEQCGTTHTGKFQCELLPLRCDADAECPSGLTCQTDYIRAACAAPPGIAVDLPAARDAGARVEATKLAGSTSALVAPRDPSLPLPPDGGVSYPTCEPPVTVKSCRPPHAYQGSSGSGTSAPSKGSSSVGDDRGETASPLAPSADAGVGTITGSAAPGDSNAADSDSESDDVKEIVKRHRRSHGCAVAGAHESGFELSWLALAGVLASGVVRRKRASA